MQKLLAKAFEAGLRFEADGEELRVIGPAGALTHELRDALRSHKAELLRLVRSDRGEDNAVQQAWAPDATSAGQSFPLTDLQHAYWLGRDSNLEMGGIASHVYFELEGQDLDVARLNQALCTLIERQAMLRAVIDRDGTQRILPTVPAYQIAVEDKSQAPQAEVEHAITATRDALSHQMLQPDRWPLFDIRVTLMPARRLRLHVSLDLLIFDARSLSIFFEEWHALYQSPLADFTKPGLSFGDYVLAEHRSRGNEDHRRAHAYWMARVEDLPPAPELPLRANPALRVSPRFSRREYTLEAASWSRLKVAAREHGLTPSCFLLALYSEVLARWSAKPHFTVNVTMSDRRPLHPDVHRLLGNFTSPILHEVDRRPVSAFVDFARDLQHRLLDDVEHGEVSGVTVLREWTRRRGTSMQAAMPVVFSSALKSGGGSETGTARQFGAKVFCISQTSQVWLDHHVAEVDGELVINWDAVDAVFEDGVLDAMFEAFCRAVDRFVDDPLAWESTNVVALPDAMQRRRDEANLTGHLLLPMERLHAGFVDWALKHPEATAVVADGRTLTYGQLLGESAAVADWLMQRGIGSGQPVPVLMTKGWEQIVAVYGALLAGGAYLPVDADLPVARQLELLRLCGTKEVLVQPGATSSALVEAGYVPHEVLAGSVATFQASHRRSLDGAPDELAYVIFTSGTTGVPKGVMIDHRGAVNTVQHINRLYAVGPEDRVLGVSSLSFDLSVYDIFGLHAVGGTLVLPSHAKRHDPMHWRALMLAHGVTRWNSAPQLMAMLVDSFDPSERPVTTLRSTFLSGDFIPVDLPDRIRARYCRSEVISFGGATEASIWSIHFNVGAVKPDWTAIPYGKALPNQTMWVFDSAMRTTPDHVKGRIFIGGLGLAKGYWDDAERTAARFITHPGTGDRLYDTGDLGRYAPDGNIVILGRDDGQVKVRGHRVELGEIEAVLRRHPQVRQCVVLFAGATPESRQLVAYVEPVADAEAPLSQALRDHLADRLPDYMVPRRVLVLERMPVSANGKLDTRALSELAHEPLERPTRVAPRTPMEEMVLSAWSQVFPGSEIGVTDDFFELGGDSLLATQLVQALNAKLPVSLEMHELFENLTVEALAALLAQRATDLCSTGAAVDEAQPEPSACPRASDNPEHEAMWADIRAAQQEIKRLGAIAPPSGAPWRAVFLTGGTGWVGRHLLAELLMHTDATLYCLVRAPDKTAARERLLDGLRQQGIEICSSWLARIEPLCGDLAAPELGLDSPEWHGLEETADVIFHLGASVSTAASYAANRNVNVLPLNALLRLAVRHHTKPLFFVSPMAVCRRVLENRLVVLPKEDVHADPSGLLTGYAASKWSAEMILSEAAAQGLPVKIYRSSHALPSRRSGVAKRNDTYTAVLEAACEAGVVPEWPESCVPGVPVDVFCRMAREDAQVAGGRRGVVHIEHDTPLALGAVIEAMILARRGLSPQAPGASAVIPRVPLDEWIRRCLAAAGRLKSGSAMLASMLFASRSAGAAVEHMFTRNPVDTGHLALLGDPQKLRDLTPVAYWQGVAGAMDRGEGPNANKSS